MEENGKKRIDDVQKLYYLIERNRYEMAENILGSALAKDPDSLELQYISAFIDKEADRLYDAEKTLTHILSKDPNHFGAKYLLAQVCNDKEDFAQAERLIIDLIRDFPREPQYFAIYAHIMMQTMNLDKAGKLAAEALRLDPEHPGALTTSILCALSRGQNVKAKEQFSDLVRNYPDAAFSAHSLYIILVENKKYRAAGRIARELLRNNPNDTDYVEMIKSLRLVTHPAMLPLYPLQRWGWHASAVMWVLFIIAARMASNYLSDVQAFIITFSLLGYIAYSWIAPPVLKRLLK
ncbi:MAG: tetratricopeptide repeat protein [Desulfobacterales bacterium]|nr:tetratricopeptide repeat protein [Desulfobacterales bacterium]